MANELVFAIAMFVLAILLIGTVLLVRHRRGLEIERSSEENAYKFKDCYDLCMNDPNRGSSRSCTTECFSYGGV
jgi:hypothetical protein